MKLLLAILYVLLSIVFLYSGFIVVYAVYQCTINPVCLSFNDISRLLPPFVLSLGVSVALITLQLNRKDKLNEIDEKKSEFFFNYCISRIDEALNYMTPRSSNYDEGFYSLGGEVGPTNYHIDQATVILNDILLMEGNISSFIHKSAYESKKKNFISSTLRIFKNLGLSSYTSMNWAGECLEEKIENYNNWIANEKNTKLDSEDYEEFVRDKRAFDASTPFSFGLNVSALSTILCFCLKDELHCHKGNAQFITNLDALVEVGLDVIHEYFQACIYYKNNDGILEKRT